MNGLKESSENHTKMLNNFLMKVQKQFNGGRIAFSVAPLARGKV